MAPKRAGDLSILQWLLGGGAVVVFSAGAAWGGAAYKLQDIDSLKAEVSTTKLAVCNLVTLKLSEVNEKKARALAPALEACKRQTP